MSDHLIARAGALNAPVIRGKIFERAKDGPTVAVARLVRSERHDHDSLPN